MADILNIIIKKIYIFNIVYTYHDLIYTNVYILSEISEKTAQMNIGNFSSWRPVLDGGRAEIWTRGLFHAKEARFQAAPHAQ